MIDIEQFCSALDGENPAGRDVEYDEDFLALEDAQRGRAERQYGDALIPAEPPDWKQVLAQATAVAGRTRDLRLACAMTRALTHLHGFPGLIRGLQMIDRLCRDMWDHVYPKLDESEGNDPTFRMNALGPLAAREGLLADLRDCTFASARGMGACTVRQLEIALGILTPIQDGSGRNLELSDIDAIAAAAQAEGSFQENLAQQAMNTVRSLQAYLSEMVGIENAPDLEPLISRLRPIAEYSKKFIGEQGSIMQQGNVTEAIPETEAVTPTITSVRSAAPHAVGEIRNSQDAARMLELICAYFEKNEPTNPAPLLLRRAQRLATMSFYEIVRDIAPDAISSVELVAGRMEQTE